MYIIPIIPTAVIFPKSCLSSTENKIFPKKPKPVWENDFPWNTFEEITILHGSWYNDILPNWLLAWWKSIGWMHGERWKLVRWGSISVYWRGWRKTNLRFEMNSGCVIPLMLLLNATMLSFSCCAAALYFVMTKAACGWGRKRIDV